MSLERFLNQAVSSWMSAEGPDSDIVLSSRIRLARNIDQVKFPFAFSNEEANQVIEMIRNRIEEQSFSKAGDNGSAYYGRSPAITKKGVS